MSKIDFSACAREMSMARYYRNSSEYGKQKFEEAVNKAICFTTREEYLEFVSEWKKLYKAMTDEVRNNRKLYQQDLPAEWTLPVNNRNARWAMMHLRMEGKARSQAARAAAKNVV
jgi:hypothetical protein